MCALSYPARGGWNQERGGIRAVPERLIPQSKQPGTVGVDVSYGNYNDKGEGGGGGVRAQWQKESLKKGFKKKPKKKLGLQS
jgi:hypothetical protein